MTTTHSKFFVTPLLLATVLTIAGFAMTTMTAEARSALPVDSNWHYNFKVPGTLNETGSMSESSSPYFWLNSGGVLILDDGEGHTMQGKMRQGSKWQALYGRNNPLDTDDGYLPQNLFRLVTRSTWEDVSQELRFKVNKMNLTDTPNRDGYSGILLMSRYKDGDNLYYAGIRQDGAAVIKKKSGGSYSTIASESGVFGGSYNRNSSPNLIPMNTWMGLRLDTETMSDGSVKVGLYLDKKDSGSWNKILEVIDKKGDSDGSPVTGKAHTGIRTDYMDVSFDDYVHKAL